MNASSKLKRRAGLELDDNASYKRCRFCSSSWFGGSCIDVGLDDRVFHYLVLLGLSYLGLSTPDEKVQVDFQVDSGLLKFVQRQICHRQFTLCMDFCGNETMNLSGFI